MSIRLEMLQVARLAPRLLGESSDLVKQFLSAQINPDGGFKDRSGNSDLYYTVFGLDGLAAIQADHPNLGALVSYLESYEAGLQLDFIHRCCLARCWSSLPDQSRFTAKNRNLLAESLQEFRCLDGGYNVTKNSSHGTVYGCFLGAAAHQDLGLEMPKALEMFHCLRFLQTPDGAWANERNIPAGSTNATAAAVTLARIYQIPIRPHCAEWLLKQAHPQGGFSAATGSPIPDLLSTATTLHALAGLEADFSPLKESCLDFVDSLWTNEGGFHGHWADDFLDCEYTFYGLLALGHLGL